MSAELMMVLNMRKKEMAFQPSSATTMVPTQYHAQPSRMRNGSLTPTAMIDMTARRSSCYKTMPPNACVSPHSVGQNLSWTSAYDQFGFTWHWIVEVSAHFALQRQTAHFAMQYAQLILRQRALREEEEESSRYPPSRYGQGHAHASMDLVSLQRDLETLGLACVFMAAKIEEVHPPKVNDLAEYISDRGAVALSGDDLVRLEGELVKELNWNLHPTTPYSWLLFLLVGEALDQPLFSTSDFGSTKIDLSGRYELFTNAIRLIDVALLDGQSIEYLPSVLAGAALLLVDPMLEFFFTAQFLQLDPKVLWDCKNWLHCVAQSVHEFECLGSRHNDRWRKIAQDDLVFVQTHVAVPSHLAYGVLATDDTNGQYMHGPTMAMDGSMMMMNNGYGTVGYSSICASPSSSDNYGCFCKGATHTCQSEGANVYHYKFGWQNVGNQGNDALPYDTAVAYAPEAWRYP